MARHLRTAVIGALVLAATGIIVAQPSALTRTMVTRADVSVPGREAVVARVEIAPGGVAGWHTHPGDEISYVMDGTVTIRDLNREFGWRLPDEQASTLAGLVLHEARQIPVVGQVFAFYGFRMEILERQRNQIRRLRVTPPAADEVVIAAADEKRKGAAA